MFDPRIINGKMLVLLESIDNGNIEPDGSPTEASYYVGTVPFKQRVPSYHVPNVLLFDYIFAHKRGLAQNNPDAIHRSKRMGLPIYSAAETERWLRTYTCGEPGYPVADVFDIPVYGVFFEKYFKDVEVNKIYPIVFTPSEPYDRCTMNLDVYDELYDVSYMAPIDHTYYSINPSSMYTSYPRRGYSVNKRCCESYRTYKRGKYRFYAYDVRCSRKSLSIAPNEYMHRLCPRWLIQSPQKFCGVIFMSDESPEEFC